MKYFRQPLALALLTVTIPAVTLFAAGCLRYGGVNGLVRRVQTEIDRRQPHPDFVPTPMVVSTTQDVANLGILQSVVITPTTAVTTVLLLLPSPTPLATETLISTDTLVPDEAQSTAQAAGVLETLPIAESPDLQSPIPSTSTPSPIHQSAQPSTELSGFRHEWQTWNNCGPATLSFYLSYYGSTLTQKQTGAILRTHADDKNVDPYELAAFAGKQGFGWEVRVNGSADLLRTFVSNGIPVLIETWHEAEPNDGMGHYRLITGYDDAAQYWIAYDSYDTFNLINPDGAYRGIRLPYAETDQLWKVFNRLYVVIYPMGKQPLVKSIFGPELSEPMMSQVAALEMAKAEIATNPNDAYAWFNLGSMLAAFNSSADAAAAFDRARQLGLPWRMLWYQYAPFDVYTRMGRHQEVLALADATLGNVQTIEEIFYWKGRALAALGDVEGARQQWRQALVLNPNFTLAQNALVEFGG